MSVIIERVVLLLTLMTLLSDPCELFSSVDTCRLLEFNRSTDLTEPIWEKHGPNMMEKDTTSQVTTNSFV